MRHLGTNTIDTARLCLRRYRLDDAADMFRNYANDPRVTKFLSWQPYDDIEDVQKFIANQVANYPDDKYHWAIEYQGQMIGGISVIRMDEKNHSCELGYCIGHDFWGLGLTTEATMAVLQYLFCQVGYHRVFAKHDVDNPASGKVMQNCGMVYEGRLREHYRRHDGVFSDALIYGILRKDFCHSS